MGTNDASGVAESTPEWWSESAWGLGLVLVATVALFGGSRAISTAVTSLDVTGSSATAFETTAGLVLTVALLAVLYALGGAGTTYLYLTRRDFEPGFVVEALDREAARLLGGLLALAVVLVWGGSLLLSLEGGWSDGALLTQPAGVFVGAPGSMPLTSRGVPSELFLPLSLLLFVLFVGPAVGLLFHGVLQNSFRRVVSAEVAIVATALVVPIAGGVRAEPLGPALLVVFALGVGYAYERTGNLAVPALAYAVLNAFTLTTAAVILLSQMGAV